MRLILASGSPRRREILARVAFPFETQAADLDERRHEGEDPETYVRRLASEKARRVSQEHPDALVLAADTAVVLGERVLGKPADDQEASTMLAALSGRRHVVLTAGAWARDGRELREFFSRSQVDLRAIESAEITRYVASGEPFGKAGAYAIQGRAGGFARQVEGSITGVIGLPLEECLRTARALGVAEPALPLPAEAIELRFRAVAGEIAALAAAHGRPLGSVRLITVTKGHPWASGAVAIGAGATDLGENYVQEAVAKREALGERGDVRWHLIGPLQRNKARHAARTFSVVHTIDRVETAVALARASEVRPIELLVQVNVMRDPAKGGIAPEALPALARDLARVDRVSMIGLMTIGREDASEKERRAAFAELRVLCEQLRSGGGEQMRELSMGMSDDYREAIAEGATMVRLGTAILGPRVGGWRGGERA